MREMISGHLVERGFTVDAVGCAEDAYAALAVASYDALVLDLGLPDADGMELLREARARSARHLPALIVTARDAVDDRARGLNAGADDYIVKPFRTRGVGGAVTGCPASPRCSRGHHTHLRSTRF